MKSERKRAKWDHTLGRWSRIMTGSETSFRLSRCLFTDSLSREFQLGAIAVSLEAIIHHKRRLQSLVYSSALLNQNTNVDFIQRLLFSSLKYYKQSLRCFRIWRDCFRSDLFLEIPAEVVLVEEIWKKERMHLLPVNLSLEVSFPALQLWSYKRTTYCSIWGILYWNNK